MNGLYNSMLECLSSAQKRLDESGGSGVFVMVTGADKMVWHRSAADNFDELLEDLCVCVWETLRKANPDITADGFAQAAHAIATRIEAELPRTSLPVPSLNQALLG
jgi:hypothetical protein